MDVRGWTGRNVRGFTLEAGFDTSWDDESGAPLPLRFRLSRRRYFPTIQIWDGRRLGVLWTGSESYSDHRHAIDVAEERLYNKLSKLMKDEDDA